MGEISIEIDRDLASKSADQQDRPGTYWAGGLRLPVVRGALYHTIFALIDL